MLRHVLLSYWLKLHGTFEEWRPLTHSQFHCYLIIESIHRYLVPFMLVGPTILNPLVDAECLNPPSSAYNYTGVYSMAHSTLCSNG